MYTCLTAPSRFPLQQMQTLTVGSCLNLAASDRRLPSRILCNLATVSIFQLIQPQLLKDHKRKHPILAGKIV